MCIASSVGPSNSVQVPCKSRSSMVHAPRTRTQKRIRRLHSLAHALALVEMVSAPLGSQCPNDRHSFHGILLADAPSSPRVRRLPLPPTTENLSLPRRLSISATDCAPCDICVIGRGLSEAPRSAGAWLVSTATQFAPNAARIVGRKHGLEELVHLLPRAHTTRAPHVNVGELSGRGETSRYPVGGWGAGRGAPSEQRHVFFSFRSLPFDRTHQDRTAESDCLSHPETMLHERLQYRSVVFLPGTSTSARTQDRTRHNQGPTWSSPQR